jgi:superfamily I DNA and/or RNA helicase
MYGDICSDIVSQANVIYATFTSSQVRKLRKQKFKPDLVIVDEAGQTPEALAWFGVLQANKAVIVGDQDQCK